MRRNGRDSLLCGCFSANNKKTKDHESTNISRSHVTLVRRGYFISFDFDFRYLSKGISK